MLTRFLLAAVAVVALAAPALAQPKDNYTRTEDVVYGRKYGTALTMDVFTPKENANGKGVIWCVSGGWYSAKPANVGLAKEFVDRGYVVFAVVHGSTPKFTIPEVLEDMHRAVRFIKANAKKYNVDPDKLGISGGSAGGHLSLMQGNAFQVGQLEHGRTRWSSSRRRWRRSRASTRRPTSSTTAKRVRSHWATGRSRTSAPRSTSREFKDGRFVENHRRDPARPRDRRKAISPAYHVKEGVGPGGWSCTATRTSSCRSSRRNSWSW